MRKVKLLALLLAVLMVVTAFAGCANTDVIESDVANLDERVTALENLLNGIDKEIDDVTAKIESVDQQIADLKGAVEADKTAEEVAALEKQLADQKAELEAQKAAAEAAKAAADAAKAAADAAAKAAKDAADAQAKANADLLKQIQELMKAQEDAEKEAAKVLADAKTAALAKIATRESGLAGKYADLVAAAKAAVNAATTENACDKAVADLEAAIVAADAAAGAAVLAAAQKAAAEEIAVIREQKKDDKAMYFTDEYEAVVKALAAADTNVAAAKTAAEVDAAVATLKTELAKYAAIDDKLYDYFTKLWGNMTEANRAVNTEAQAYVVKAEKHFMDNFNTDADAPLEVPGLFAYVYGAGEDNSKLVVDLPYMLGLIDDVYTDGAYANVTFTKNHVYGTSGEARVAYSALTADVATYSLAKAVAEATKIDKRINDFVTNKSYAETWAFLRNTASVNDMFGVLNNDYLAWNAAVKPLAEANLALLTNGAKIERIKGIIDNYMAAEKALIDLGEINYSTQTISNVFAKHGYENDDTNLFYDVTEKTYASQAIYAPIDAELAAWTKAFGLVTKDATDIIDYKLSISYGDYTADREYVKLMDSKFASFKSDIVPLIKEVNKQTAVDVASFQAYSKLATQFGKWVSGGKVSIKINDSGKDSYTYVNKANFELMVSLTGIAPNFVEDVLVKDTTSGHWTNDTTYTKTTVPTNYDVNIGLYGKGNVVIGDFVEAKLVTFDARYAETLETFFTGDYTDYKNYANAINTQITYLNDQLTARKLYTILPILGLEDKTVKLTEKGVYVEDDHTVFTILNADGSAALASDKYEYLSVNLGAEGLLIYTGTTLGQQESTKLSDGTKRYAFVPNADGEYVTVRVLEEMCEANDYNGLAECLVNYDKLDALKSAYENRIATLKADGADAIIAAVKNIKVVDLEETTLASKPGNRTHDTIYKKKNSTSSKNVHYVTLSDLGSYEAAATALDTWINDKAGNVRYKNYIDTTFKINITVDDAGTTKEVQYPAYKEQDILQDYDAYLGNVGGQMKVLVDARDAFVKAMAQVNAAMALKDDLGDDVNDFDVEGLAGVAVTSYKKYVEDETTYYDWTEVSAFGVETTYTKESSFAVKSTYTISDLIEDAYREYAKFQLLNRNYTSNSDISKLSDEKYLESYTVDGFKAYDVYSELVLLFAKAHVIAEMQTALEDADFAASNDADLVRRAIAGVAKCTILQGTDASAVSNWIENYSSYVTLTVPTIDNVAKRSYNSSSKTESVANDTVALFSAILAS